MAGKLVITCVNAGNYLGKGAEYVNILFDMVRRNISDIQAFKFVCFTDDIAGLHENIECRELPGNLQGWYNKLYLFKRGHFEEDDRVVFFDLDTIICGGLDDIIKYQGDFAILKDFYQARYGPGVMLWNPAKMAYIWDEYEKAGCPQDLELGDLTWINDTLLTKPDALQDLFPRQIVSYKIHATHTIPKGARVICFHGLPRPHEVQAGWVPYLWKIGGGRTTEWRVECNTSDESLISNINSALKLGLPTLQLHNAHEREAIIVGGGPSLKQGLISIKERQKQGAKIFAANNTYHYLTGNGIRPDYHVMLDARIENKKFVPAHAECLYSSQCHPDVFRLARKHHNRITLWHTAESLVQGVIGDDTGDPLVGGGSSVGLKSIAVAHVLGYRNFHLYGLDSSYSGEENHAYHQPINDSERVMPVTVNGREFKVAPWMATQAEQFKEIAAAIIQEGCALTVHGDGLLPYIAHLMSNPPESVSHDVAA